MKFLNILLSLGIFYLSGCLLAAGALFLLGAPGDLYVLWMPFWPFFFVYLFIIVATSHP